MKEPPTRKVLPANDDRCDEESNLSAVFEYPEISIDEWNSAWVDSRLEAAKNENVDALKDIKQDILGGSGSLAVVLALLLTVAVPALLANPCANTSREFYYSELCETFHILSWGIAACASFVGIVNATNLYSQSMYTAPSHRGIAVLLAFPRVLGGRDQLTTTMQAFCCAIIVDTFINYNSFMYIIVTGLTIITFMAYFVSDAVFHTGGFGVANKYHGNSLYGVCWYNLFMEKKINIARSKKTALARIIVDVSTINWITPLLIITAVCVGLTYSVK